MLTITLTDTSHAGHPSITFTADKMNTSRQYLVFYGCELQTIAGKPLTPEIYSGCAASIEGVAWNIDSSDEPIMVGTLDWTCTVS